MPQKMELVPKILLVLWLANKMSKLSFIILAMCRVYPLNFVIKGIPELFIFFIVNTFRL